MDGNRCMSDAINDTKERLFFELVVNSLIRLYSYIDNVDKYVSLQERKRLLLVYYKRMLDNPKYKPIRQDMRGFIHGCRSKSFDMEAALLKLYVSSHPCAN
ncbi:hypothetical protein BZG05_11785 [Salinivibrio kushneri]|nr:hypothetical protein BZG05_11785 [Salinivibrio kushneri]